MADQNVIAPAPIAAREFTAKNFCRNLVKIRNQAVLLAMSLTTSSSLRSGGISGLIREIPI